MSGRARTGITVAYSVKSGIEVARVMHNLGVLREYYSPLMLRKPLPSALPRPLRERSLAISQARALPRGHDYPIKPLLLGDFALRAPLPRTIVPWPWQLAGAQAITDLSLLPRRKSGRTFWFESGIGLRTASQMKRRGVYVALHRRALHHVEEARLVARLANSPAYVHPEHAMAARLEREYQLSDLIVCNSTLTRNSFLEQGYDETRLAVVNNPIDLEVFTPRPRAESSAGEGPLRVLYVGTLDTRKNVLGLARVCASVGDELLLTLVGRDIENLSRQIQELLPSAQILGPLPSERVLDQYRDADIVVLPSYVDAFGLVAAEAMAVGTPVIVTTTCGVADLVDNGRHGYVVTAGEHDELVEVLERLARDRKTLGQFRATLLQERERLGFARMHGQLKEIISERLPT